MKHVIILMFSLTLLITHNEITSAGQVYVFCSHEKKDILIDKLSSGKFNQFREDCKFTGHEFAIDIIGSIDAGVERPLADLKNIMFSDSEIKRKIEWPLSVLQVRLNSPGGDVETAIQVGRILRDLNSWVLVAPLNSECSSSCVFVLAGGVYRFNVGGKIGIHRPYFSRLSTKVSPNAVSRAYEENREKLRRYLLEMHIPLALLDHMEQISPENIYYLTGNEAKKYQLHDSEDPVFDERRVARQAELRGIASAEYRQRLAEKKICGAPHCGADSDGSCMDQHYTCEQAVSWGLSIPEYTRRQSQLQDGVCDEFRKSTSVDELWDCIRSTMLGKAVNPRSQPR